MNHKKTIITFLILMFLIVSGCEQAKDDRGLMKEEFWGKGEDSDMPWAFESVCADKGRICGDTHFDIDDFELSISYEKFAIKEDALKKLNEETNKQKITLRRGIIEDESGVATGEKVLTVRDNEHGVKVHSLFWTRGSRFTMIVSESLLAIEKYEKDRKS